MKKVLIFGDGQMGRVVADRLAYKNFDICTNVNKHKVSIVDKHNLTTHVNRGIQYIAADWKDVNISNYDLIINCLPSHLGFSVAELAVNHGINCVDLSFMKEDPYILDKIAKKHNSILIPDAGLAPGLTNLFVGRELSKHNLKHAHLYVGGVSQSPFDPYGYAVTWSLEDLLEDYIRPARVIVDSKLQTLDSPTSHRDIISINNTTMEFFKSDGLRTLLRLKDRIPHMYEATLRWPGHCIAVEPLIKDKTFIETLETMCNRKDNRDTVVFHAKFRHEDDTVHKVTMLAQGTNRLSALAKTTAYTCAIVAEVVLDGVFKESGVHPLESIGKNPIAFQFLIDKLASNGVQFKHE